MAFSVPLLQEWRRRIFNPVLSDAHIGRHTDVLHGIGPRTNVDDRWIGCIQNRPNLQR